MGNKIVAPTVVPIRGLPLSGKSRLARELSLRLGWHYVDVDDVRALAAGVPPRDATPNPWIDDAAKLKEGEDMRIAYTIMHAIVTENIAVGRSIIIVATYSRQSAQNFLLEAVNFGGARIKGIRCSFNDTDEEIERRLGAADRGTGGCKTVEHYRLDKTVRHDYANLWPELLEVNTSEPFETCVEQALQYIQAV